MRAQEGKDKQGDEYESTAFLKKQYVIHGQLKYKRLHFINSFICF